MGNGISFKKLTAPALMAALLAAGCGGGGGSSFSAPSVSRSPLCSTAGFDPNYSDRVQLYRWSELPIRVRFDGSVNEWERSVIRAGFAEWVENTGAPLWVVVDDDQPAHLTVRIAPLSGLVIGQTTIQTQGTQVMNAVIDIRPGLPTEVLEACAAHEMGHALGITGHSERAADLMYAYISADMPTQEPTNRDVNTLRFGYCAGDATRSASGQSAITTVCNGP